MRWLKTIVSVTFLVVLTHFALAQNQDAPAFPTDRTEPLKQVQLYPNPAVEYLVVKFNEPRAQSVKLSIHSIIGNTQQVETEIIDEHEVRLHVKELPSGYYFLAVKDGASGQRSSFKFLKR